MGLCEAVSGSDPRVALEAIRDLLAERLEGATDRQLVHVAPMAKQLVDVLDKLGEFTEPEADSVDDSRADVERILRSVG